jgi:hypothetical protein
MRLKITKKPPDTLEVNLTQLLEDVLKVSGALLPLLHKQSPPAWTNEFLIRAGGEHYISGYSYLSTKLIK